MDRSLGVLSDLAALAVEAVSGPSQGLRGHRGPQEPARKKSLSGPTAGVFQALDRVKNLPAEVYWNQNSGITRRKITKEALGPNLPSLELRVRAGRRDTAERHSGETRRRLAHRGL